MTIARIGMIGDVHTEAANLAAAIELLDQQDLDVTVCMGDLADGYGDEVDLAECCERLQKAGIVTVCGNHDRWLLDDELRDRADATLIEELDPEAVAFLSGLPPSVELDTRLGKALLCHGLGDDDMGLLLPHDHGHEIDNNDALQALRKEGRYALVLNGHSHRRMVRHIPPLWIANAGTLHRDGDPCVGMLDLEAGHVTYLKLDGTLLEQVPLAPPLP